MTTSEQTPDQTPDRAGERADILDVLRKHRALFLHTVAGLDDEQAAARTTASELTLGGLIKHVTAVERQWAGFVTDGPWRTPDIDFASIDWSNPPEEVRAFQDGFRMVEGETLAGLVAAYEANAEATDALVLEVDLDATQPLPKAPWFPPDTSWSARRVFAHILAETAQHAGHADFLREAIDGQKSMG